jgi:hypothetical protein
MPQRCKFQIIQKFIELIEKDINTQENIQLYSHKREEYFRSRVNKYSIKKNYLLDNPYNQRLIERLNINRSKGQEQPKKMIIETQQKEVKVSKTASALELNKSKYLEDIIPVKKATRGSAKNIYHRTVLSAVVKSEANYIGVTTINSEIPTSPTRLVTYDHTNTIANLKNEMPKIRLMSAIIPKCNNLDSDKKSILAETAKSKFNRCIEVNKQFLLKNNPNMNLLQVAEIFGSSKLIHYKNINI